MPAMRHDLPTGTVTFVFTDIEGSTALLDELGPERYGRLLSRHHRVCRAAWEAHDGVEVDTAGDAFFVAFPTASGALSAASDAQRALAELGLRVRMGVHTGEAVVGETGYVGIEVHRAARIAAAAHGGQVVVSQSTAALVARSGLVELGEHRLKDLAVAEHLYQLGAGAFPRLKSLYQSNLPVPATPFLGRAREVAEVAELLARDELRLLTLTGPGGTGKTRLALQAAAEASDRFPDGVRWVSLAPLRDPEFVAGAVAQAVDVAEQPGREPIDVLVERLAGRRVLVLLDNAEHLLPGLATTVSRLHSVGGPALLVTSRERLQVAGEHVYPVAELDAHEAVELFLARAAAVGMPLEHTAAVDELCGRLEQLPLALELAAARTVVFSPEQLLDRLGNRLDLLRGGRDADPRQRTLRAAIEWSYDLLAADEQQLLRALSVFAGGSSYEAAAQVAQAEPDTLQSLLDKSLLRRRDTDDGPRYWMLETIREFAAEELDRVGEGAEARRRHACYVQELVDEAEPRLAGAEQVRWLRRLDEELGNIRVALDHLEGDGPGQLALAAPLWRFWEARGHVREAQRWLKPEVTVGSDGSSALATKANVAASRVAWKQGDLLTGRAYAERAVEIARGSGRAALMGVAYENLGCVVGFDDMSAGCELLAESVAHFRSAGDTAGIASALNNLAYGLIELGRGEAAAQAFEESIELWRELGSPLGLAFVLHTRAYAELRDGAYGRARVTLEEALTLFGDLDDVAGIGDTIDGLAHCANADGDVRRAVVLWSAGDALRARGGFEIQAIERRLRSTTLPAAEAILGPEGFATAWEEGQALSLDEVVGLALHAPSLD